MKNNKKLLLGSMGIFISILVILSSTVQAYPIIDPDPPPPPPSWETGANQLYIAWGFVISGTYTDTHAMGGGYLHMSGLPYYLAPYWVGFVDFSLRFPYPSSASYSKVKLKLNALTLIGVTIFYVHYVEGGYDGFAIHGGYEVFTLDPYKRVRSIQFAGFAHILYPNVAIDYARIVYSN